MPSEPEYVIITSRSPKFAEITLQWLKKANLKPVKTYFIDRTRTRANMIDYKSEKINELGIIKYYEDDPKIARALKKRCPNTEIVLIEPVIKKYEICWS